MARTIIAGGGMLILKDPKLLDPSSSSSPLSYCRSTQLVTTAPPNLHFTRYRQSDASEEAEENFHVRSAFLSP